MKSYRYNPENRFRNNIIKTDYELVAVKSDGSEITLMTNTWKACKAWLKANSNGPKWLDFHFLIRD